MRILWTAVLVSLTSVWACAQRGSIKVLAEVPVQFGLGYEGRLSNRFSLSLQAGLLTEPNSTIIVNLLKDLGTDPDVVLMIDQTFKFGVVGEVGVNYNFRRNYAGVFFQTIRLHGGDAPSAIVESYFDEDLSTYPVKRGRTAQRETYLTLQSTLYQCGVLFGRRFPLPNKHLEIDAEVGVSANLASQSTLSSEYRQLDNLSAEVNDELDYYYSHYAFIPSLSLCLVYHFRARE